MKWDFISVASVILLVNCWIVRDDAGCSRGWRSYKSSCYYFGPDYLIWDHAFNRCKMFDSQMVEIEDTEENNFLANVIKKLPGTIGTSYYVGLTDKNQEGQWKWANSGKSIQFSNWYPGEPNNSGNKGEDCACFWWEDPGPWNDVLCSITHHYICEKSNTAEFTASTEATNKNRETGMTKVTDTADVTSSTEVTGKSGKTGMSKGANTTEVTGSIEVTGNTETGMRTDTAEVTSSTEVTGKSGETGLRNVTVPIYVLAVLVLVLVLILLLITRKCSQRETNTNAVNTTVALHNQTDDTVWTVG